MVWTKADFITLLFLVFATIDYRLWESHAPGSFVRSEGKAEQPTAQGLLQIYATHTASFFMVQASFIAIKNKRRSDAKEGLQKLSLFIPILSACHGGISTYGPLVRLRGEVYAKPTHRLLIFY